MLNSSLLLGQPPVNPRPQIRVSPRITKTSPVAGRFLIFRTQRFFWVRPPRHIFTLLSFPLSFAEKDSLKWAQHFKIAYEDPIPSEHTRNRDIGYPCQKHGYDRNNVHSLTPIDVISIDWASKIRKMGGPRLGCLLRLTAAPLISAFTARDQSAMETSLKDLAGEV